MIYSCRKNEMATLFRGPPFFCLNRLLYLIARAILLHFRKVSMPYYPCSRIIFFQSYQEFLQGFFLLLRTSIGRPSSDIQPPFVTDTDAVGIIPGGMCPYGIEGTPRMNHPVAGDVVVIADVGKATGTMVTTAVVHGVTLRGTGGTTMDHNQVDAAVVLVLAAG